MTPGRRILTTWLAAMIIGAPLVTLAQTGTYTISIDPQSNATGSAQFTLYDVPADTTGSISIGGPAQNGSKGPKAK